MNQKYPFHDRFIKIISTADLPVKDKVNILEYAADECLINNNMLGYLELKYMIKEIKLGRY